MGFEIDVAKKVAADMDVDIEFVPTAWDGIIPALISGKFDVIIGGMSIRAQRNLTINFTTPYAHSGMGIAANSELTAGMMWPDDYNSPDVTFACRRGATSCDAVDLLFPKATARKFDDDSQSEQEVLNGNAHAFVSSYPKPTLLVHQHPDKVFLPTTDNLTRGRRGVRTAQGRSGRTELLLQLDRCEHERRLVGRASSPLVQDHGLGGPGRPEAIG